MNIIHLIILFVASATLTINLCGQNVEVFIHSFRSSEGHVIVSVFKDNQSFQEEKPFMTKTLKKSDIVNGILKTSLILPAGVYGMALLDDENSDKVMKYNLLGMPLEGFGFSNYVHKGFSRPVLSDFDFTVSENKPCKVVMTVQYF
jgi:uncharacterized protein (DUF2141 family)